MDAEAPPARSEESEQLTAEWEPQEENQREPSASGLTTDVVFAFFRVKLTAAVVASFLVIVFLICFGIFLFTRHSATPGIILFIGDGFGPASVTFARYMFNRSLSFDAYLVATVKTFSANSLVTDSAAAATAYSCGEKTNNTFVAVLPDGTPCYTILEAAQAAGWRVGLIVTSELTDATPAAFSAHVSARANMGSIAEQQLQHKIDIMIGGGKRWFAPLLPNATELGVTITADWNAVRTKQVKMPFLAALTDSVMPYMIDRPSDTHLPTLAECFQTAIEYLTQDTKPFFLMVEGSRIDHAGHANDPATQWLEIGAFESAFASAARFVANHPRVALISTSDHETGGLTLGTETQELELPVYNWYPEVLKRVRSSGQTIFDSIKDLGNRSEVQRIMGEATGIELTDAEYTSILAAAAGDRPGLGPIAIGRIISQRARIGWTTTGHTGIDVNLYAAGAAPRFRGPQDNTEVGRALAALHRLNIGRVEHSS